MSRSVKHLMWMWYDGQSSSLSLFNIEIHTSSAMHWVRLSLRLSHNFLCLSCDFYVLLFCWLRCEPLSEMWQMNEAQFVTTSFPDKKKKTQTERELEVSLFVSLCRELCYKQPHYIFFYRFCAFCVDTSSLATIVQLSSQLSSDDKSENGLKEERTDKKMKIISTESAGGMRAGRDWDCLQRKQIHNKCKFVELESTRSFETHFFYLISLFVIISRQLSTLHRRRAFQRQLVSN